MNRCAKNLRMPNCQLLFAKWGVVQLRSVRSSADLVVDLVFILAFSTEVEFITSLFHEVDTSRLQRFDVGILSEVLSSKLLKIKSEDWFCHLIWSLPEIESISYFSNLFHLSLYLWTLQVDLLRLVVHLWILLIYRFGRALVAHSFKFHLHGHRIRDWRCARSRFRPLAVHRSTSSFHISQRDTGAMVTTRASVPLRPIQ
jgi:hypothetical protein